MAGDVGGSASATKFSSTPAQNSVTGNPSVGTQGAMQALGSMSNSAGMNSNMNAGGKDGGGMQPQQTVMGTPIVYGNTYLPQSSMVSNRPASLGAESPYGSYDYGGGGDGGGGGGGGGGGTGAGAGTGNAMANGTTSVPGYAYGTDSVAGYARGTMGVDDDPWSWTNQQPIAPLSANITPSQEQPGNRVADPVEQQLGAMAMGKGINALETGINEAYKVYNAPLAAQTAGTAATTVAPVATTVAPVAASVAPVAASVAPVAASVAPLAASVAPVATTAGTAATTAGLGSALGAGGTAMMGALASNPVGWAIGAGLLAKKLKLF